MTRLILIRHGETDYSLKNSYCGFSDPPLNEKGLWQSERLSFSLKDVKADKVYSSNLQRAFQSAKIIFKNLPIEQIADFREINFGIFEGLRYEEIIQKYPKLYRDWVENPKEIKIPRGERLEELRERVMGKLSFILSENKDKAIALVTHGGPIRVILCNALKFGLERFWQIEQNTGALNIIDYPEGTAPVIVKMNETTHLTTRKEATSL